MSRPINYIAETSCLLAWLICKYARKACSCTGVQKEVMDDSLSTHSVITSAAVTAVEERPGKKLRHVFDVQVNWFNGDCSYCRRTYHEFFTFHCKLLDKFPLEGGVSKEAERSIPFLPGKQFFKRAP